MTNDIELASLTSSPKVDDENQLALSVNKVDVRPAASADLVLRDISFSITHGSLAMLIGPVASGKTTLLKAILGETVCERGSITVTSRRMAYCSQTPWLPNVTIRQAICSAATSCQDIDEEWYQTSVRACALDQDIASLPQGDQTQIGSGSTILSGGQKHRVALARAVYARANILILDNVLSALDAITKESVSERLFSKTGIFKRLGSTVLLVTHTSQ